MKIRGSGAWDVPSAGVASGRGNKRSRMPPARRSGRSTLPAGSARAARPCPEPPIPGGFGARAGGRGSPAHPGDVVGGAGLGSRAAHEERALAAMIASGVKHVSRDVGNSRLGRPPAAVHVGDDPVEVEPEKSFEVIVIRIPYVRPRRPRGRWCPDRATPQPGRDAGGALEPGVGVSRHRGSPGDGRAPGTGPGTCRGRRAWGPRRARARGAAWTRS